MNKSVLPLSFDAASLSKPALKKPVLAEPAPHDNFAEHLSQSRRELAKDKAADKIADRAKVPGHTSQKPPVKKEDLIDKKSPLDEEIKTEKTEPKEIKETEALKETDNDQSDQESLVNDVNNPVNPANPTPDLISSFEGITETAETDLPVGLTEIQLESETGTSLADTNDELMTKGVDARTVAENFLKGIDAKAEQKPVVNDDQTVLSEIIDVSNPVAAVEEPANVPLVGTVVGIEPKIVAPMTGTSVSSAQETNKNGMDLPLELVQGDTGDTEEASDALDDFTALTGDIKAEDKSTKTDLFKTLLTQSQNEKTSVTEKTATSASPLIATTSATTPHLATANRLFVPQTQVGMNVAHPHWGNAMGEKIMWMANQQLSTADIRLDPPELGSLQVRVNVQQDQANITFISPHPQVRELLDQQVTRLREMFAEQGLQLGQVDIADRREQESRHSDEESRSKGRFVSEEPEEVQVMAVSSLYLVDQFV